MGRKIKVYLGQLLDEWLDDEDNLDKWESNTLTASDRRISPPTGSTRPP